MCEICASFRPHDPACIFEANPPPVPLFESFDAAESVFTGYEMAVGDSFTGSIGFFGDRDWIAITLESGTSYEISLSGTAGGLGDPNVRVFNSDGVQQADDDDGGPTGLDSFIALDVSVGGTFYISAEEFGDDGTGGYLLSVTGPGGLPEFTPDQIADQLTTEFWRGNGGPRRFNAEASDRLDVNLTGLTSAGKALARLALESWSNVTGFTFVEVSGRSDIVFDDNQRGAFCTSSVNGSDFIIQSQVNISTGWLRDYGTTIDSYGYQTYLHEIGHALGLGHAGNYNGEAVFGDDNHYLNDSWQATVMSYFDQDQNTFVNADYAYVVTPMIADIIAIRNMYGTNPDSFPDDTIYGVNASTGGYLQRLFGQIFGTDPADPSFYTGEPVTLTILDSGGIDTIDLSLDTSRQRVDLRSGAISDVGFTVGSMSIARGTIIENFLAGSGNDSVTGNEAANNLLGLDGRDALFGGDGNDVLEGGNDADQLSGGSGRDAASYRFSTAAITLDLENLSTRTGDAIGDVYTSIEIFIGSDFADRFSGNSGSNSFAGGLGVDRLQGRLGNDVLAGDSGNDILAGNVGADNLAGGAGQDRFVYAKASESTDTSSDVVTDFRSGTDKFDFRDIDANSRDNGRQDWTFIGFTDFKNKPGELHLVRNAAGGTTFVGGDLDGDGRSDFVIELTGLIDLVRGDFLL